MSGKSIEERYQTLLDEWKAEVTAIPDTVQPDTLDGTDINDPYGVLEKKYLAKIKALGEDADGRIS